MYQNVNIAHDVLECQHSSHVQRCLTAGCVADCMGGMVTEGVLVVSAGQAAKAVQCSLEYTTLRKVTQATEIYYDPDPMVRPSFSRCSAPTLQQLVVAVLTGSRAGHPKLPKKPPCKQPGPFLRCLSSACLLAQTMVPLSSMRKPHNFVL